MDLSLDVPVKNRAKIVPKLKTNTNNKIIKQEEEKAVCENIYKEKFLLINSEEIEEMNFPDFDKESNDLYEPFFEINNLKNFSSKVFLIKN